MKTSLTTFLLLLVLASAGLADPKAGNDYSKQILGRWLGSRKFEIYYPDGTWAVQRNEESKPDKEGRHWHIDGNKLTLTYSGGTSTETIVSLTPSKFVTKDEGYENARTRADK